MIYGFLTPPGTRRKPSALMTALYNSARKRKLNAIQITEYKQCDVLVLYGWGGAKQQAAIKAHKGRYVAFDMGYWKRAGFIYRKWRVSIDGFHCPDLILKSEQDQKRATHDGIKASSDFRNPKGHILLIGNAPKSIQVIESNWSHKMAKKIRHAFPDKRIIYRPKPGRPIEPNVDYDGISTDPIDSAIKQASLVVCRHSNVAVDCAIRGVPVVCEDGAASVIFPNTLEDYENQPDQAKRQKFLCNLAWWQWSIDEITGGKFWPWLEKQLEN